MENINNMTTIEVSETFKKIIDEIVNYRTSFTPEEQQKEKQFWIDISKDKYDIDIPEDISNIEIILWEHFIMQMYVLETEERESE